MKFKIDKGTGYLYSYSPNHYLANKAGKVMQHTLVMTEAIGRRLEKDECVHHIDRDRTNNKLENLRLLTHSEHSALHALEDKGYRLEERECPICRWKFACGTKSQQVFCSNDCAKKAKRKFEISKEDLEAMVWMEPTVKVAKRLGVSDVAIGKRCKKLGIAKPPRGYWLKASDSNSG